MDMWATTPLPENHKFYKHFKGITQVYLTGPNQNCYLKYFPKILHSIKNFEARDGDVYVVSFPKTGTTWLQEIVYLIMNNLDFEKAKNTIRDQDFPFLEINMSELPPEFAYDEIQILNNLPSPRLIKTHLPYCLLPPKAIEKKSKFLYISRNAKDTMTSYYHFARGIVTMNFIGDFADFAELFLEGKVPWGPYIPHVKGFWEHRHDPNVFFTTYEDLTKDQVSIILKVAKFLDRPITLDQAKAIAEHCKFDNLKFNKEVNKSQWREEKLLVDQNFKFMRKGVVGDWKNHLTPELIDKCNKWIIDGTGDSDVKYIM